MNENRMREHKAESELREWAKAISEKELTICTANGEQKRNPTAAQKLLVYRIAYGALLGLNWGESTRRNPVSEQAIVNATEFQYDLLLNGTMHNGETVNGYLGIYCPLKNILRVWETA